MSSPSPDDLLSDLPPCGQPRESQKGSESALDKREEDEEKRKTGEVGTGVWSYS